MASRPQTPRRATYNATAAAAPTDGPVEPAESAPTTSTLSKSILHNILRFHLHLHTIVEFNEAGKIVYIRDLVDLRDLWEGIVPFGRPMAWIGRRVVGVLVASIGRFAFGSYSPGEDSEEEERPVTPIHQPSARQHPEWSTTRPPWYTAHHPQHYARHGPSASTDSDPFLDHHHHHHPFHPFRPMNDPPDCEMSTPGFGGGNSLGLDVEAEHEAATAPDIDSGGEGLGRGDLMD